MRIPPSWPNELSKAVLPNSITLGIRISTYNLIYILDRCALTHTQHAHTVTKYLDYSYQEPLWLKNISWIK